MKCKKHPKYKGIRRPQVPCIKCWDIYLATEHLMEVKGVKSKGRSVRMP